MDNRDRNPEEECGLDDPLCLEGADIQPDGTERVRASNDEESVRRRRQRAGLGPDGDDRTVSGIDSVTGGSHGATAIDMGAGGQGSGIKGSE